MRRAIREENIRDAPRRGDRGEARSTSFPECALGAAGEYELIRKVRQDNLHPILMKHTVIEANKSSRPRTVMSE